jgi:hypothetical protein
MIARRTLSYPDIYTVEHPRSVDTVLKAMQDIASTTVTGLG